MSIRALSSRSHPGVHQIPTCISGHVFMHFQSRPRFTTTTSGAANFRGKDKPRSPRWQHGRAVRQEEAHASRPFKKPLKHSNSEKLDPSSFPEQSLEHFWNAIWIKNADQAYEVYCTFRSFIPGPQVARLVTLLRHNCLDFRYHDKDRCRHYAQAIAEDLMSGNISPHHELLRALLTFFKDNGDFKNGEKLWNWSQDKLRGAMGINAYAAGIMLLLQNGTALEKLEAIWQQALTENSRDFLAYHMSPNAILPDRTQLWTGSDIESRGLNAISLARLRHGDIKNAYLAVDSALRLYPAQSYVPVLVDFIRERPTTEAFTILQIACRQGFSVPHKLAFMMVEDLNIGSNTNPETVSTADTILIKLDVLHAIVGSSPKQASVGFFGRLSSIMYSTCNPRDGHYPTSMRPDLIQLFCRVLALMDKLNLAHDHSGSTVRKIFGAAGHLQSHELFAQVNQVSLKQPVWSPIHLRTLLRTAGILEYVDLLKTYWERLMSTKDEGETNAHPFVNFLTLMYACADAKMIPYFKEQTTAYRRLLEPAERLKFDEVLANIGTYSPKSNHTVEKWTVDDLNIIIDKINAICDVVESKRNYDFKASPLPMKISARRIPASDDALRLVYEKMTTDPYRQPPSADEPAKFTPICSNGFPIDELRYQNWKAINELLAEADASTEARFQRIGANYEDGQEESLHGLELENEIRRLRTPQPTPTPATRQSLQTSTKDIELLDS